ncbi:MAG: DHH family phosphoesterase [Planctomycetota bacterium]
MSKLPSLPEPNADQRAALELLSSSPRVLLTGHERPDGDCLGSQAALARVLTARGQSAVILEPDAPDPRFLEITRTADFRVDDGGPLPPHDLVVMLDGGDLSRTGGLADRLRAAPSKKLVVDHHLHDGDAWWDAAFVDTRASATGVLVRRIAAHLDAPIDSETARALFTTLVTDTGWFKYSNTDALTLEIAAELIGLGVRPAEIYGDLFQRETLDHPGALAAALARTAYYADGRVAVIDVPATADGHAFEFDSDAALDVVRSVEAVEVALVLRGLGPARCKLSARSKGAFDARALCATFGGGGHAKAAGATIESPLADARAALVERALEQLEGTRERRAAPRTAADAARVAFDGGGNG